MEYNLLFERFLNPERVSMPDFDVDFCFERRGEVIDYVIEKYGVDSFLGKLSSIIQASTDTTLYIIIVYFSTINIKKIGKTLLLGFLTNILTMLFCIVVSYIILSIF